MDERLSVYDARAVFFVIGRRAKKLVPLLERITALGHVIGNHSHLHRDRYVLPDLPQASFVYLPRLRAVPAGSRGIRSGRQAVPASGRSVDADHHDGAQASRAALRHLVAGGQGRAFRHPDEARAGANQLLERVRPGDIVLLHDNSNVIPMLDVMLPALRSRGYDLHNGIDRL